ncbi:MAG: hypothetical protein ACJA2Q_001708 [Pseudohongiellaceae bacterium]|jgi:hypothetical protein
MTSFTQDTFISYAHIDNQPMTADSFGSSSGPNLLGLRPSGRPRSRNQVCLSLIGLCTERAL